MDKSFIEKLKIIASDLIDSSSDILKNLSLELWKNPELFYKEFKAHQLLTDFLECSGFDVKRKYILETGFRATYSKGSGPNITFLCEYDALPNIGHACGHNLIAVVGVAAGLAAKAALEAAESIQGTVTILGTPAEEEGGGKIDFVEAGAFRDIDIALMSHPAHFSASKIVTSALQEVEVTYIGRESHAASNPWDGVNALDAAVMAYTSISHLRQQMHQCSRVHGIITKGGVAPNIIPNEAQLAFYIRASTFDRIRELVSKVKACFDGAAVATGCQVKYYWQPRRFLPVLSNRKLLELYDNNAVLLGTQFTTNEELLTVTSGSTDMGNVSHVVPAIHPYFNIGGQWKEHTIGFSHQAASADGHLGALRDAKALSFTAIDLFCQPHLIDEAKIIFKEDLKFMHVCPSGTCEVGCSCPIARND